MCHYVRFDELIRFVPRNSIIAWMVKKIVRSNSDFLHYGTIDWFRSWNEITSKIFVHLRRNNDYQFYQSRSCISSLAIVLNQELHLICTYKINITSRFFWKHRWYYVFLIFRNYWNDINDENNFIRSESQRDRTIINIFFRVTQISHPFDQICRRIYDVLNIYIYIFDNLFDNNFFTRDKIRVIYFIHIFCYFSIIETTRLQGHRYLGCKNYLRTT